MSDTPQIKWFFEEETYTFSYVIHDMASHKAAIIDSVLNFDEASGRTHYQSADDIIHYIKTKGLEVEWILETHVHADHLSAAQYLKTHLGGKLGIGSHIHVVQQTFAKVFHAESSFHTDGRQFDVLFNDGDVFNIGQLECKVLHTPGHTPACVSFLIDDACFVGDTLFMPDYGTARCDFPGGDAQVLYQSIQKLLALPPKTRLFLCHDYKAEGRDHFQCETNVAEQCKKNVHVNSDVSEQAFIDLRNERDAKLAMPRLLIPSVQINMRAGEFPPPEDNGQVYLKIPINLL